MVTADFDGSLPGGARCLYSFWSGYLEKPEWVEIQSLLKAAGGGLLEVHTSGPLQQCRRCRQRLSPKSSVARLRSNSFLRPSCQRRFARKDPRQTRS
jgi:hypothetical protein